MNFIINHGGFFLGISVTLLLALIGYYAEKKDSSKNKNIDNSSKSTTLDELPNDSVNNNVSDSINVEDFPKNGKYINFIDVDSSVSNSSDATQGDTSNINDIVQSDTSNIDDFSNNIEDNGFNDVSASLDTDFSSINSPEQNNIVDEHESSVASSDVTQDNILDSDQSSVDQNTSISFGMNDFEDINMSLEDLEKKNYSKIINNKVLDDSDNYYYSDLDEFAIDNNLSNDSASSDMDTSSQFDNTINNDVTSDLVSPVMNDASDSVQEIDNTINNDVTSDLVSPVMDDTSDSGHEFDNEVQFDNTLEELNSVSDNIDSVSEISNGEDNQQFTTDGSVVDPLSDSFDDDIWKF